MLAMPVTARVIVHHQIHIHITSHHLESMNLLYLYLVLVPCTFYSSSSSLQESPHPSSASSSSAAALVGLTLAPILTPAALSC
mmetsp:Transcript_25666/g.32352  ORF Transcript_25666/g.32352 Transcript_25666/m.32352 type:complete len:83 (+) Transcript_25666:196-444(+)